MQELRKRNAAMNASFQVLSSNKLEVKKIVHNYGNEVQGHCLKKNQADSRKKMQFIFIGIHFSPDMKKYSLQ